MKKVTLDFNIRMHKQFDIPKKWQDFFDAWVADDEDRTDKQWELVDKYTFEDFVKEQLPFVCEVNDVEIYDYDE